MNNKDRSIRDDVRLLQEDVAQAAADAKEEVIAAAQAAFGRAQEKIGVAGERSKEASQQVDHYVHANAWAAVGIAAAAGLVMGLLLGRHRK